MKRLDKDDPRRWHRTVGKGQMKRVDAEGRAMKAVPLPGVAPQPMPLEVGPGSFWPTPMGSLGGERLFIDHDAERLDLTVVHRSLDTNTDVEALHTVPLCFAALQTGPVLWICLRMAGSVHRLAAALGADTAEAAELRRLILDPSVRKTARIVFVVHDMVKLVRTIEDVSFPWRTLREAARLPAQGPQPVDLCTRSHLDMVERITGPGLYRSDAAVHSPPDFGMEPPRKRARRSPKAGASERQS